MYNTGNGGTYFMTTAITNPDETFRLNPEALEFVQTYLSCLDVDQTAESLGIKRETAVDLLKQKEVQRFMDTIFMEQGYMNRFKLSGILEKVIDSKLEEAEETGVYSGKDLIDILTLMHKIQMDHAKVHREQAPSKQTNVQVNNYGDNLGGLIDRIVKGE